MWNELARWGNLGKIHEIAQIPLPVHCAGPGAQRDETCGCAAFRWWRKARKHHAVLHGELVWGIAGEASMPEHLPIRKTDRNDAGASLLRSLTLRVEHSTSHYWHEAQAGAPGCRPPAHGSVTRAQSRRTGGINRGDHSMWRHWSR